MAGGSRAFKHGRLAFTPGSLWEQSPRTEPALPAVMTGLFTVWVLAVRYAGSYLLPLVSRLIGSSVARIQKFGGKKV